MTDALEQVVERLWATHRGRTLARLDEVARGLEAMAAGATVDADALARLAHLLAGSLGTYARPGSALLGRAEQALRQPHPERSAAGLAGEIRSLQDVLSRP